MNFNVGILGYTKWVWCAGAGLYFTATLLLSCGFIYWEVQGEPQGIIMSSNDSTK